MKFPALTWICSVAVLCWFVGDIAATYTFAEFKRIQELLSPCLPPQLTPAAKKIVDLDKLTLTCYNPNTNQQFTYNLDPYVIRDVFFFSDGCRNSYMIQYDETKKEVVILKRTYNGDDGSHFVLEKDALCTITMNHENHVTFTPVSVQTGFLIDDADDASIKTRSLDADLASTNVLNERADTLNQQEFGVTDFTVEEYLGYLAECLKPLLPEFDATNAEFVVEARHNDGLLLSCILDTGELFQYRVIKDARTGLLLIDLEIGKFLLNIDSKTGKISIMRCAKATQSYDSLYLVVDESQKLCSVTINQFGENQFHPVNTPVGYLTKHDVKTPDVSPSPGQPAPSSDMTMYR